MRMTFAALGLPETIVSDNEAIFTSEEFSQFLKKNGV
jgi:transposase InsO family protein